MLLLGKTQLHQANRTSANLVGAVRLLIFFTAISFMPLNISQKCRAAGFIDAALKMHCFFPWRMIIY